VLAPFVFCFYSVLSSSLCFLLFQRQEALAKENLAKENLAKVKFFAKAKNNGFSSRRGEKAAPCFSLLWTLASSTRTSSFAPCFRFSENFALAKVAQEQKKGEQMSF
jgi:hypothetical protein